MPTIDPTEVLARRLARLNPSTVKFDIGAGGGVPALTAQDIAAALGMVPAGLGRELLQHVHWQEGARRRNDTLLQMMTMAQLSEHNRLEQAMVRALCQVAIATPDTKRQATQAFNEAHLARWPQWVEKLEPLTLNSSYADIRLGVLEELKHPKRCPECRGREHLDRHGETKNCERCLGSGTVVYGPTWRAKRLGMKRAAFIERWQRPYQWMLDLANESVTEAERALIRALR